MTKLHLHISSTKLQERCVLDCRLPSKALDQDLGAGHLLRMIQGNRVKDQVQGKKKKRKAREECVIEVTGTSENCLSLRALNKALSLLVDVSPESVNSLIPSFFPPQVIVPDMTFFFFFHFFTFTEV